MHYTITFKKINYIRNSNKQKQIFKNNTRLLFFLIQILRDKNILYF